MKTVPERITVHAPGEETPAGNYGISDGPYSASLPKETKWVREDIATALQEENEKLRAHLVPVEAALSDAAVEKYISSLQWSDQTDDYTRTLVAGNIRAFAAWLEDLTAPNTSEPIKTVISAAAVAEYKSAYEANKQRWNVTAPAPGQEGSEK